MTNTTQKNVISMSDYQKSARTISQNEASNALEDCRDVALNRLTHTLAAMLDKMDEDLDELAKKANGAEEQIALQNARREARLKRYAIESTFKKHFTALFKEKASRQPEQKPAADPFASFGLELSLVDDTEVEENIAISNMATALQDNCEGELQALVARMGFLLDSPDLDLRANPVSPEVIHNTFKAACQQMEAGFNVKMAIMRLFDRYLAKDLPAIYKEINSRLVSRQILPEIRPGYRGKPKSSNTPRPNTSQPANQPAGQAQQGPGHTSAGGDNPQEVFALLQQLLNRGNQPAPQNSFQGQTGGPNFDPTATSMTAGFFDSLNQLQHGDQGVMSGLEGLNAEAFASGTTNVLHQIRGSSFAAGMGQFDAITIDIVAMLFDYIFEDPKVPETMKGLLGRLQIPVLKVAMLDKGFFSTKSHPTRKLLDTLAAAAVGRGDQFSKDDPLYKETDRLVQRVVDEFESEVTIFAELLTELEAFLDREEKASEETVERSAKIIHDRERLEIARVIAEDEIRQRVEGTTTITTVRHFLQNTWVHALTQAHTVGGEDGDAWKDALKAMDELLWSVKPKMSAEERKQLVTRLPGLLKRLHTGMAAISMDAAEQKQFFANLVACHTRAVKAGLGGETTHAEKNPDLEWTETQTVKPEEPTDTILDAINEATEEQTLVRKSVEEGDVKIEEVTVTNEVSKKLDNSLDFQWAELMGSLKRGSWVDFKQSDGVFMRYKLSWVSPLKKVYLFTNISSQKALSISPQAMEMQLREGSAIIIQDTPLMDRAVENLLESLQQ